MTITSTTLEHTAIVTIAGRMDADWSAVFETACSSAAGRHLIVDLRGLTYVSSMGLRAFLSVAKQREAAGGQVRLVGVAGFVKQVFDLTRVTALFHYAGSVEDAVAGLPA